MTVLQVAYPLAPVSLDAAGGAEQIMALLDRGLEARGVRSIAIACAGSRTCGELVPIDVQGPFDERVRRESQAKFRDAISHALHRESIDLIHLHGVDFYDYCPGGDTPVLATLHLPASFYPPAIWQDLPSNVYFNCVSEAQRRDFPESGRIVGVIGNGVPWDLFPKELEKKENYVLALGRVCREKGFHLAVDAASQAGVPLWVAGTVYPYPDHEKYFSEELLPRLRPPHRFLGPAGFAEKVGLLSRARCLLVPSLVPETGSLAAMEAMACGTPVISFAWGAPADFIEEGKTGFLARDVDEMAAAIRHAHDIDPEVCRRAARARFDADRMVDSYLELYGRLAVRAAN